MAQVMAAALLTCWLDLIAADRAAAGVPPLTSDPDLSAWAQHRADGLATRGVVTHDDWPPDDTMLGQRLRAENLVGPAEATFPIAQVEALLLADPPHAANVLNPDYTAVGVGVATLADGRLVWVQEFGT